MKRKKQKLRLSKRVINLLPWIWMGLIFYASSRERIALTDSYWLSFLVFKLLHIIEYGILFLLWFFALDNKPYRKRKAIIFSFTYGVFDELHQTFVPTREGTVRDVLIDLLGVLIFSGFVLKRIKSFVKEKIVFVN